MSKLKKLAGETVLYGLGSIVPRFLNFLLVSLHTEVFNPDAYGIITKLFAYVGVLNTVYLFGMETTYFRFAIKPGADERRVFNLTQTAVLTISGGLTAIIILWATPIAQGLNIPSRPDLVIWLAVVMFIDAAVAIPFARLRQQKKALRFASAKLINIGILIGLNVYFLMLVANNTPDVSFVILANLAANAFYIVFFARTLLAWRPAFDRELSPVIFNYAYPIMISGLAGITNEMFSRITLDEWLPQNFYPGKSTDYAVGVFGACYKLAMPMSLGIMAFRYAAEPFFFANATEKNSPQLFARINHYFVVLCCCVLLAVSINLDILKYFLRQSAYWEALHVVPILLLAYLLSGTYYNFSVWFKLTDKTYYGTFITIGGALITVAANYVLIPLAGYEGSSWATLICAFAMAGACYGLGQKYFPIPYAITRALAYIAVTMAIIYGVNALEIADQGLATAFHLLIIVLYGVGVYIIERKGFRNVRA
jgi:O-antigen/teichoic acid export membrane protein